MCFLFVDRILTSIPGKLIRGVKHVTWDDVYLAYDNDGQISFASSLIGETLGQLAAWNVMAYHDFTVRPVAGIVANARLLRAVHPGETLFLESVIDELDDKAVRYHSVAKVGQAPVFIVDGAIGPLLPMTNFIDVEVVKRQFNEINRPGGEDDLIANTDLKQNIKRKNKANEPPKLCNLSLRFENVYEVEVGQHWIAEKLVSRAAAYFPDHFPNNPVLPMTVLLECKINLAHEFVAALSKQSVADDNVGNYANYKVRELRKIKMNDFIRPGDVVMCHLKLKQQNNDELILSCQSLVAGKRVCVVEVVMGLR